MSKKKRKFESRLKDADKWLEKLTLKDLKRECVVRGLEFDKVVDMDIPDLSNWFRANFIVATNHDLLDMFDDWNEKQIIEACDKKGIDPKDFIHPSLRLGYIAETDEEGTVTKKHRVKVLVSKKKKKRERTVEGLFSGTKKAYTYKLQKDGLSKPEVVKKVLELFPDASPKSVGIWFNKSRKGIIETKRNG